jgi:hypothetical protein
MKSKTFKTKLYRDGSMCFIEVPFDPKPVFVPLRKSNREAAGLEGGETLRVTLALDEEKRVVEPPKDLVKALKASPPAWERWREASYSHQREWAEAVEGAKQPATRVRRIAATVAALKKRAAKAKR